MASTAQVAGLHLIVNGRRYTGWKSIRVTRSMETIAGSFALEVSDRWGAQEEPWPILEEDACSVELDGQVVISGYIDSRDMSIGDSDLRLSYTGRDRAAALVDCAAVAEGAAVTGKPASAKWTYRNIDVLAFARELAAPFGVGVSLQAGLVLSKVAKLVVNPGDTAFEALSSAAARAGVLAISDTRGGIAITRAGPARAASLVQGVNVKSASVSYNASSRFRRYLIASQVPGTDEASGEATNVIAEAVDLGVRRADRVTLIRPDKGYNTADARRRADWEARTRAARAEQVTVTVQGWRQPGRLELWAINETTTAAIPRIGINGDLVISQVEFSIDDRGGRETQLSLVRPDAFEPEPNATVKDPSGLWKELANGGL